MFELLPLLRFQTEIIIIFALKAILKGTVNINFPSQMLSNIFSYAYLYYG